MRIPYGTIYKGESENVGNSPELMNWGFLENPGWHERPVLKRSNGKSTGYIWCSQVTTLWQTYTKLLNMAIEIADLYTH